MELPSLPTNPAPAPRSNVAILVVNSEAAGGERRDAILPPLQIAPYQATKEITATDMMVRGSVVFFYDTRSRSGSSDLPQPIRTPHLHTLLIKWGRTALF